MEQQDNIEKEFVELLMEHSTTFEFPMNFPNLQICDLIMEVSSVLGCRKDYLLIGLCMATSAVIGKKISLKDRAYTNFPSLWVILLGTAGVNKTSPLQWALSPVEDLVAHYADEFQKELKAYNKRHDENQGLPVCKEFILKDTTHEKRLMTLCENETLLQFNDELAELLGSAERYNKNGDIASWLSIFSNDMIKVSRKSQETTICRKPSMSILTTTQPTTLKELLSKRVHLRSGLIPRFLFVVTTKNDKPLEYSNTTISKGVVEFWNSFLYRLDEIKESRQIVLSDRAKKLYAAFYNYIERKKEQNIPPFLLEYALKMNIHILRFALLVQIIKNPQCEYVDEECMRYSIQAMSYFQQSAGYVYNLLTEGENKPLDKTSLILSLVNDYKIPQVKVAELFGVNKQNINEIIRRHKKNNIDH